MEHLPEFDGDFYDMDDRFRIVAIHMEDRCLDHLRRVRWIRRGARITRIGREADLVVDDEMDRAAGAMALQAGEAETFGNHTLAGERRIAMNQSGMILLRSDIIVQLILRGAHLAEHDRIDDFEMRRIGSQRQMNMVAIEVAIRRPPK